MNEHAHNGKSGLLALPSELGVALAVLMDDGALSAFARASTVIYSWCEQELHKRCGWHSTPLDRLAAATAGGGTEALSWARRRAESQGRSAFSFDAACFKAAAAEGHLDVLQWLYDDMRIHGIEPRCSATALLKAAAERDQVRVVRWLIDYRGDSMCLVSSAIVAAEFGSLRSFGLIHAACLARGYPIRANMFTNVKGSAMLAHLNHKGLLDPGTLPWIMLCARDQDTFNWFCTDTSGILATCDWQDMLELIDEERHLLCENGGFSQVDALLVFLHVRGVNLTSPQRFSALVLQAIEMGSYRFLCAHAHLLQLGPTASYTKQRAVMMRWFPRTMSFLPKRKRMLSPASPGPQSPVSAHDDGVDGGNGFIVQEDDVVRKDLDEAVRLLCKYHDVDDLETTAAMTRQWDIFGYLWGALQRRVFLLPANKKTAALRLWTTYGAALDHGDMYGIDAVWGLTRGPFTAYEWSQTFCSCIEAYIWCDARYAFIKGSLVDIHPRSDEDKDARPTRIDPRLAARGAFIVQLCERFPEIMRSAEIAFGDCAAHVPIDALTCVARSAGKCTWMPEFTYMAALLGRVDALRLVASMFSDPIAYERTLDLGLLSRNAVYSPEVCAYLAETGLFVPSMATLHAACRLDSWPRLCAIVDFGPALDRYVATATDQLLVDVLSVGHTKFVDEILARLPQTRRYATVLQEASATAAAKLRPKRAQRLLMLSSRWACDDCQLLIFSASGTERGNGSRAVCLAHSDGPHESVSEPIGPQFSDGAMNVVVSTTEPAVSANGTPSHMSAISYDVRLSVALRAIKLLSRTACNRDSSQRVDDTTLYETLAWLRSLHIVSHRPRFASSYRDAPSLKRKRKQGTAVVFLPLCVRARRNVADSLSCAFYIVCCVHKQTKQTKPRTKSVMGTRCYPFSTNCLTSTGG